MLVHYSVVPRLLEGCSSFRVVVYSRSKPVNESLDLVWPLGALHAFWPCKTCLYLSHFIHSCILSIEIQSKSLVVLPSL
jgi:hypothetical protein